jgi:hypothetical protein
MAYLDDLKDGLYDQMIEDAKAQIPDEVEDLW